TGHIRIDASRNLQWQSAPFEFEETGSLATARAFTRRRCCRTARCSSQGGQDGLRRQNQKSFRSFAFFCNSRRFFLLVRSDRELFPLRTRAKRRTTVGN